MCIEVNGLVAYKAECYKVFSLVDDKLYSCFRSCVGPEYKTNKTIYAGSLINDDIYDFPSYKYNENYKYNPYCSIRKKFSAFATKNDAKFFLSNIEYSERNIWDITNHPKVIKRVLIWDVYFGSLGLNSTNEYEAAVGGAILIYPEEIV